MAKSSKNVLFISSALRYFDSSASDRNRILVNELSKYFNVYSIEFIGIDEVPLIDLNLCGEELIKIKGYRETINQTQNNKSDAFFKLKYLKNYKKLPKIVLRDRFFFLDYIQIMNNLLLKFNCDFHLIVSSSDPVGIHFQATKLKLSSEFLKNAIYWQYWGDPLYGCINHKKKIIDYFIEKYLLSKANLAFWVSYSTLRKKKDEHKALTNQMKFLPRIVNVKNIIDSQISVDNTKRLKILYAGDYHKKSRDISKLVLAFESFVNHSLTIVGNGDIETQIPDNVIVLGRVSKLKAQNLTKESDILIIIANKNGTQIPGKVYDYATTNKFILVLYEDPMSLEIFPFKSRISFCKNEKNEIENFLHKINIYSQTHDREEYELGSKLLVKEINSILGSDCR